MKHRLSFCDIEQLSDNIFEVTIDEGVTIDDKCAEEAENFWRDLRTTPYKILVNNRHSFSYSFLGSQTIGEHYLERKTAILVDDQKSEEQISTVLNIKRMFGNAENRRIFRDREEALAWLEK